MIQGKEFSQQPLLRILIWNTILPARFLHQFENKVTIFHMEEVSEMSNYVWILLKIEVN